MANSTRLSSGRLQQKLQEGDNTKDHVTVRCNGGISALSAFFNGFGSAISVNLPMELNLSVMGGGETTRPRGTISSTIGLLKKRFGVKGSFSASVTKAIPQSRGLKSSSALTLSLTAAFLKLNSIEMNDKELLSLAADISIENGTSSTGAYDDLCSAFYGGICITDNRARKLILRREVPEKRVVIAYSSSTRSSASVNLSEMNRYSTHADVILDLVKSGLYYEAMTLNGNLMGVIHGQNSYLIRHFLSTGASYSSQCGKGPAVFAVFDSSRTEAASCAGIRGDLGIEYKKTLFSNSIMEIE